MIVGIIFTCMKDLTDTFKDMNPHRLGKSCHCSEYPRLQNGGEKKEYSTDEERWAAMLKEYITDYPLASWVDPMSEMQWLGLSSYKMKSLSCSAIWLCGLKM